MPAAWASATPRLASAVRGPSGKARGSTQQDTGAASPRVVRHNALSAIACPVQVPPREARVVHVFGKILKPKHSQRHGECSICAGVGRRQCMWAAGGCTAKGAALVGGLLLDALPRARGRRLLLLSPFAAARRIAMCSGPDGSQKSLLGTFPGVAGTLGGLQKEASQPAPRAGAEWLSHPGSRVREGANGVQRLGCGCTATAGVLTRFLACDFFRATGRGSSPLKSVKGPKNGGFGGPSACLPGAGPSGPLPKAVGQAADTGIVNRLRHRCLRRQNPARLGLASECGRQRIAKPAEPWAPGPRAPPIASDTSSFGRTLPDRAPYSRDLKTLAVQAGARAEAGLRLDEET